MQLRGYQEEAIDDLRRAISKGNRRVLLQAATGSGKTVIASQIIRGAEEKGNSVLFLAHRRELVYQAFDKLKSFGVDRGLLMAGEYRDVHAPVTVASIDTLRARALSRQRIEMPDAQLVVIDECHRSLSPTYMKLIEYYKQAGAVILGMTATPIRADGKGLGQTYQAMVQCPSVGKLIEAGYLVQPKYYAPTIPDLAGVRTTAGDYNKADLETAMNTSDLVGDVVSNWSRLASNRQTIVFTAGVAHSIHLHREFERLGVKAAHIDANTPTDQRARIIERLRNRDLQVITNCMVLTEGFDEPTLDCVVLARPTKNMGLYMQMAGRVLRPADFKTDTLIIDHSGAVYRHGFVEDEIDWGLEEGKLFSERERDVRERLYEEKTITCVKCSCVYSGQLQCPQCKHVPEQRGEVIDTRHGDLHRVDKAQRKAVHKEWTTEVKRRWYRELLGYAQESRYKKGWAYHKYYAKFGKYPSTQWSGDPVLPPSQECRAYIRYLNIRAAKAREKRGNGEAEAAQSDEELVNRQVEAHLG